MANTYKRYKNRIEINPKVMVGKPVIKGTRITVELILRQLSQGITTKEILENHPHLTRDDIYAAIEYAAEALGKERTYALAPEFDVKTKTLTR